ncbi:hypothetical protein V5O48_012615, partial [Marasmius crinis-equi]
MSSDSGGPPRGGRGRGRSVSVSQAAPRAAMSSSTGGGPVRGIPSSSSLQSDSGWPSTTPGAARERYSSALPSQRSRPPSRGSSVDPLSIGSQGSRAGSPAQTVTPGLQMDVDSEDEGGEEYQRQDTSRLVLSRSGDPSDVAADAGAVVSALVAIRSWINHHAFAEFSHSDIRLDDINLDARRLIGAIEDLQGPTDEETIRLPGPLPIHPSHGIAPRDTPFSPPVREREDDDMDGGAAPAPRLSVAGPTRGGRPVSNRPNLRGPPPRVNRATRPTGTTPWSYANAARRGATVQESVIAMARAAPSVPASQIMRAVTTTAGGRGKGRQKAKTKTPYYTAAGPSRKQVLVSFDTVKGSPAVSLPVVTGSVNAHLRSSGNAVKVLSTSPAYQGWSLMTSVVPSDKEILLIRRKVLDLLPADYRQDTWVGLPASTSYLKVEDVPYWKGDNRAAVITGEDMENTFSNSPLKDDLLALDGAPRIVHDSKKSTTCTVYFNIWDSQAGSRAKRLIDKRLHVRGKREQIRVPPFASDAGGGAILLLVVGPPNRGVHTAVVPTQLMSIAWRLDAAGGTLRQTPQSLPLRRASRAPTERFVLTVGANTLPRIGTVSSGGTASIVNGLMLDMRSLMENGNQVRVLSFNVAKNYLYLDVLLETLKDSFDILFIQEPPWRLIRYAPSASSLEGEAMVGAPLHPSWILMAGNAVGADQRPRVLTYVSRRLGPMRPASRFDVLSHRDILIMSLTCGGTVTHFVNVYSDVNGTAMRVLMDSRDRIPELALMAGDFNCHSSEWDPAFVGSQRGRAVKLVTLASHLGLGLLGTINLGPTFIPRTSGPRPSVLDLVFVKSDDTLRVLVTREVALQGPSDHIPVSVAVSAGEAPDITRQTLPSGGEKEAEFISGISDAMEHLGRASLSSAHQVEAAVAAFADRMGETWLALEGLVKQR